MTKRVLPVFVLITLAACLLSYKFGSAPTARAQTTLPAAPAEWSVFRSAYSSAPQYATVAGSLGVQHVADCIIAGAIPTPGSVPKGPINVKLYDGSATTSPSAYLLLIDLPQGNLATGGGQVQLCGLNLQGTAGRPMQLEIGGELSTYPWLSVNLVGHDAQ